MDILINLETKSGILLNVIPQNYLEARTKH